MAGMNLGPSVQRMGMFQQNRGNAGNMNGMQRRPMGMGMRPGITSPFPSTNIYPAGSEMMGGGINKPSNSLPQFPPSGPPVFNPGMGGGMGGGTVRPPTGGEMMGPQIPPNTPMPNITGNSPTQDGGFWGKYNRLASSQMPSGGGGFSGDYR